MTSDQKIVVFSVIAFVIIGGVVSAVILFLTQNQEDTRDPAETFYVELAPKFRDCGSERIEHGVGENERMRKCFIEAYEMCDPVKMHQQLITVEGDPIFTTVTIEGKQPRGCAAHMYIDNRDRFGAAGIVDTMCYFAILDSSSGQHSLFFDECEDRTQRFLY